VVDRHREQDQKVNPDQKIFNRFTSTSWQDLVGSYGPYDMRYLEASEWKSRCIAYLNSFSECQYFYEHPDRLKNLPITGASFLRLMSAERVIRLLLIQYAMLAKWAEEEHRASSSPVTSLSPPDAGSVNAHAGVMVSVAESASSIPVPAASSGQSLQGPMEAAVNPVSLLSAEPPGDEGALFATREQRERALKQAKKSLGTMRAVAEACHVDYNGGLRRWARERYFGKGKSAIQDRIEAFLLPYAD